MALNQADPIAADYPQTSCWPKPFQFAAILAVSLGATFYKVVCGLQSFCYRDYGVFTYPLASFHRESFWRGEIPLWNSFNSCGVPFLAQWNTLALYPASLIYLILPLPWSLGIFCLSHLYLAGMGMYVLAFSWTNNRIAAAIAGITFAFNGVTWNALMWTNNISALGWMPWVVWIVERAYAKGGRWVYGASLLSAMQMLAGAPEIIIFTWFIVTVLLLNWIISSETGRGRVFLRFLSTVILTVLLAAAQLLPFLDLLVHSQRDSNFGDSSWAMPLAGLANYLVPTFHLIRDAQGVFVHQEQQWTSSYYAGVGALGLACLAAKRGARRQTWLLFIIGALGILLAMGNNSFVYPYLRMLLPQIGFMRFPIKFVVLVAFVIPLLAAIGFASIERVPSSQARQIQVRIRVVGAILLALICLIACYEWKSPRGMEDVPFTLRGAASRAILLVVILSIAPALAAFRLNQVFKLCWLMLFWVDVLTHSSSLTPTVRPASFKQDTSRGQFSFEPQFRVQSPLIEAHGNNVMETSSTSKHFHRLRAAFVANCNMLDHVSTVDGFFSLYIRNSQRLSSRVYSIADEAEPLRDFLGIAQIKPNTVLPEQVWRRTCMPIYSIGQEPVFADDARAFESVLNHEFRPREQVYLPLEAQTSVSARRCTEAHIASQHATGGRLMFRVQTPAPSMLVIAQSFYHPWHAYVDGRPVRIWRANHAFQALEVSPGEHTVTLIYQDTMLWRGGLFSLLALGVCALGFSARKFHGRVTDR